MGLHIHGRLKNIMLMYWMFSKLPKRTLERCRRTTLELSCSDVPQRIT